MLRQKGLSFEGLRVSVSGSGNVAQYAVEKAMALGAKGGDRSDSSGTVVDPAGFTAEKLAELMEVKNHLYGRVADYARRVKGVEFLGRARPGRCRWTSRCPARRRTSSTSRTRRR